MQKRHVLGGRHLEPPVWVQHEPEALGVDEGVVPGADEHQVVQVGAAAVGPVADVVGVQLLVSGAAGEAAALTVQGAEQLAQRGVGVAGGAAEVVGAQVGLGHWS